MVGTEVGTVVKVGERVVLVTVGDAVAVGSSDGGDVLGLRGPDPLGFANSHSLLGPVVSVGA